LGWCCVLLLQCALYWFGTELFLCCHGSASKTLQEELLKTEKCAGWSRLTAAEKVTQYNDANREVAILCNHQRSVSKAQETQLENLGGKLETLKNQKKALKKILKCLNENSGKEIPVKKNEAAAVEKATKALEKAKKMKESAKTNEEKIAATQADENAKLLKKEAAELKFNQAHLWEKTPSKDQVAKKITTWTDKIAKMEMNIKHKDDNKEVSLGTSKVSNFSNFFVLSFLVYKTPTNCFLYLHCTAAQLHGSSYFSRLVQEKRSANRKDFFQDNARQI
jgi:uncharacterized protein with von Willebrand factor type A (vWA) domain